MKPATRTKNEFLPILLLIILFSIILIRTSWICDDAYITFRTVDNFIHGFGLRWNVDERVQAYTNALWMFVVSLFYIFTHEIYYTVTLLSLTISICVAIVFGFKISKSLSGALLGLTALTLSKAFTDYSTSGLENPLTHLLLILFIAIFLKEKWSLRDRILLCLISATSMLNRLDTALLYLPALIYIGSQTERRVAIKLFFLGFLPIVLWELFSLFYYGFPFPSPAYSKLGGSIPALELIHQGLLYLLYSVQMDPLTPIIILGGFVSSILVSKKKWLILTTGSMLYLLYIIKIGGDFMPGRFLAAPFLIGAASLFQHPIFTRSKPWMLTFLLIFALGIYSPQSPLRSGSDYGTGTTKMTRIYRIGDERAFYYPSSGLLNSDRNKEMPSHEWVQIGRQLRSSEKTPYLSWAVGYMGFFAGPKIHLIEGFGLADAFLARLSVIYAKPDYSFADPPTPFPDWIPGHFYRPIPHGYFKTIESGKNVIVEQHLAELYDKLSIITKGNLWSWKRLKEVWNFNTGKYNYLINLYYESPIPRKLGPMDQL